ncbi:MAG: 23S rRNA (uracil(1939)-C(5))-methyltransferase RlmD [Cytophagales bacterium]|jgi:23S rRNA (uracil1939-C5)-methyltransferase|nr:23S rRNA (uracil(1939)-C(5))-methyltransferase RlmD [Cytophagales bacterium]
MDLQKIKIEDLSEEGYSIGHLEGRVVFVNGICAPGDEVEIKIFKKKKNYYFANLISILQKDKKNNIEPVCQHFGVCNGCQWQHVLYEKQLEIKNQHVLDKMERIAKLNLQIIDVKKIIGTKKLTYYRNKLEFSFSSQCWITEDQIKNSVEIKNKSALGFHKMKYFNKIVPITKCFLQQDPSNEIRNAIDKFCKENNFSYYNFHEHVGDLRNLIIRTTTLNQIMVIVQFGNTEERKIELLMNFLKTFFPQINSLQYIVNKKLNETYFDLEVKKFHGEDYIFEEMDNLKWKIKAKSFFQTNSQQASVLYKNIVEMSQVSAKDIVYDLYTGVGTIALYFAKFVKKVIGVEIIESAIEDAKENALLNKIDNAIFLCGDVKDMVMGNFFAEHGKPNIVVIDPPRSGIHPQVIETILKIKPEILIYVSCNPATQARDIFLLKDFYEVKKIQPVDMFPNTYHVENICALELKVCDDEFDAIS